MEKIFKWLDDNVQTPKGLLLNQLLPISISLLFYVFFIASTHYFLKDIINPNLAKKVSLNFRLVDVIVGAFLYFVTAIDYALIIGRMQVSNPGSKARVIMNISTVIGCYIGVTIVLFVWGFAREITWLIIPILIFAGSVMIKLAYEGLDYFVNSKKIPSIFSNIVKLAVNIFYFLTRVFIFWMPEISKPSTKPMKLTTLAAWSLILPFTIGLDDLIGYMGAMTIYNVFGLLIGIYFADILIDILIFVSPKLTKKVVNSAILSFIATIAFLYLAYKSYTEAGILVHEHYFVPGKTIFTDLAIFICIIVIIDLIMARIQHRKAYIKHIINLRK